MAYVHETRTKKRILQKKTNQENLAAAINILENIEANYFYSRSVSRNSKNRNGLVVLLNGQDQKMSLSVRAATAISMIDSMSQIGGHLLKKYHTDPSGWRLLPIA